MADPHALRNFLSHYKTDKNHALMTQDETKTDATMKLKNRIILKKKTSLSTLYLETF